jgi:hypothetical protein
MQGVSRGVSESASEGMSLGVSPIEIYGFQQSPPPRRLHYAGGYLPACYVRFAPASTA